MKKDNSDLELQLVAAQKQLDDTEARLSSVMKKLAKKEEQLEINRFMATCQISEYKEK